MSSNNELALLFSGGTDSTYTAALMGQRYERVHLITYDRLGFLNTKNSQKNALLLKNRFGQGEFIHRSRHYKTQGKLDKSIDEIVGWYRQWKRPSI